MKIINTIAIMATAIAFVSPLAAHADNDGSWSTREHAQMNAVNHDTMPMTGKTAMGARMERDGMTSMPGVVPDIYRGK